MRRSRRQNRNAPGNYHYRFSISFPRPTRQSTSRLRQQHSNDESNYGATSSTSAGNMRRGRRRRRMRRRRSQLEHRANQLRASSAGHSPPSIRIRMNSELPSPAISIANTVYNTPNHSPNCTTQGINTTPVTSTNTTPTPATAVASTSRATNPQSSSGPITKAPEIFGFFDDCPITDNICIVPNFVDLKFSYAPCRTRVYSDYTAPSHFFDFGDIEGYPMRLPYRVDSRMVACLNHRDRLQFHSVDAFFIRFADVGRIRGERNREISKFTLAFIVNEDAHRRINTTAPLNVNMQYYESKHKEPRGPRLLPPFDNVHRKPLMDFTSLCRGADEPSEQELQTPLEHYVCLVLDPRYPGTVHEYQLRRHREIQAQAEVNLD